MKCVMYLLVLLALPAVSVGAPPDAASGPAQPVVVENEPIVRIGNQPTVDIGSVVDVDAVIVNDSVPVEVVNDAIRVKVDPRTRGYVLEHSVSAGVASGGTGSSAFAIPFDSYITGVSFYLSVLEATCAVVLEYDDELVRPGGSNTTKISQAALQSPQPAAVGGFTGSLSESTFYPLPNLFIGEGVSLRLGLNTGGNPDFGGCSVRALVYLLPAVTGITPGGVGLDEP